MVLAVPVALLAGVVSFFSPCVVPLLPGYLSYMTGVGAADVAAGHKRGRMLLGTTLFVLGLAVVFVATGVVFGTLGQLLLTHQAMISRVLGVVIIVLGLAFAGVIGLGRADVRIQRLPAAGLAAAPVLGAVFALGWTPCIGPALAVVFNLGLNEGTALRGGVLGFAYALGLGLPFVLAGLAFAAMNATIGVLRRHQVAVMRIGGLMMVAVGVLLVTGLWDRLMGRLLVWVAGFETVI
ncbi:MAG: cytochrome c biogenesis protein CcdA [Microlunatus sp.]|nr:cytochrome c biogenesis protein CcdA [Microlunatus sp.]MDN5771587.1 cytochrome c biogenesis protein CcdA [Microlunatus sp.]